ncbi:MAG: 3-dehydroquinate synthase [Chloroflexota bacterium]
MKHLFLYGPPGAGKTTTGQILAKKLDMPFLDLDVEIERISGRPIPDLMAEGETVFRDVEARVLAQACEAEATVVALGGGALLRESNRQQAESCGRVVLLCADASTLAERLASDDVKRPLLAGDLKVRLEELLARRRDHYDSFAMKINQEGKGKTPEQMASEIQQKLGLLRVHTARGDAYDVLVQPNGLGDMGKLMRARGLGNPVAVIADENVAKLHSARAMDSLKSASYDAHLIPFPAGETSKHINTVMSLWRGMLNAGLDRKSTVVALGGGVTGDLAGFAASTFMRGISWVGVPTTLLAMVDSSLGGKTGFDLPEGKNLVGAFHDPKLVLIDPQFLSTLPRREMIAGMAEVIKHGIISDPELYRLTQVGWEIIRKNLNEVIGRAIAVKINFIEKDPFEKNIRAALNIGHTIGHGVEIASGFQLLHGEAIAIGLCLEADLAERMDIAKKGLAKDIAATLSSLGLPIQIPKEISRPEIIRAMRLDKKKASGVIRFALPVRIGEVKVGVPVEDLEDVFEQ